MTRPLPGDDAQSYAARVHASLGHAGDMHCDVCKSVVDSLSDFAFTGETDVCWYCADAAAEGA